MKDGYHVTCTMSSNGLLDKGHVAENLQKECLWYVFIIYNSIYSRDKPSNANKTCILLV